MKRAPTAVTSKGSVLRNLTLKIPHLLSSLAKLGGKSIADKVTIKFGQILYAEDDITYQMTTPRILARIGFEVKVVGNGQLAVDEFKENSRYASVLLDNQMKRKMCVKR